MFELEAYPSSSDFLVMMGKHRNKGYDIKLIVFKQLNGDQILYIIFCIIMSIK